jgi:hypothetical protein
MKTTQNKKNKIGQEMKRLMDEKKKTYQSWSMLEDIYKACANSVVSTLQETSNILNSVEVNKYPNIKAELEVLSMALAKDCEEFSKQLQAIHALHADKKGLITTPGDVSLNLDVYESYVAFNSQFVGVTTNTIVSISEKLEVIYGLENPTPVTDDGEAVAQPIVESEIFAPKTETTGE